MKFQYTRHAEEILSERGIEKQKVEKLLEDPPQQREGKGEAKIAQGIFTRKDEKFLLRVVYKNKGHIITVITAYWTSKIEKYWEG